jgi:opacity protein-like surface antigen
VARLVVGLGLAVALLAPATAVAQDASMDEPVEEPAIADGLSIGGYLGSLFALSSLADSGDTLSAEFSTKLSFGADVAYYFGNNIGLSVKAVYSAPQLTIQRFDDTGGFPQPFDLGKTDMFFLTGNVMYRPRFGGAAGQLLPFFGVGAGIMSMKFPTEGEILFKDQTDATLSLFGGALVSISRHWLLHFEMRDYVSKFNSGLFEPRTQHDFFIEFGVRYQFR